MAIALERRRSEVFCEFVAEILFLLEGLLDQGVISPVGHLLLHNSDEVLAVEQAVQQSHPVLVVVDGHCYFHEVFGVDVIGLELQFGFEGRVCFEECLLYYLSEWFQAVGLCGVGILPLWIDAVNFEQFPVVCSFVGVLLHCVEYFVDQEAHLEVFGIVHVFGEDVQGLCKIELCFADEACDFFEGGWAVGDCRRQWRLAIQWVFDEFGRGYPLSIFYGQHPLYQHLYILRHCHIGWELQERVIYEADQLWDGTLFVRTHSEQHLVEDDSQRPNVCSAVVDEPFQHLWGHVDWAAHHCLRHVVVLQQLFAETEICQLYHSRVEEDVGGFQVPMEDVL